MRRRSCRYRLGEESSSSVELRHEWSSIRTSAAIVSLRRHLRPLPDLRQGDEIRWQRTAGYTAGPTRMGGTLYITKSELVYVVGKLGHTIKDWAPPPRFPLSEIKAIDVMERTFTPYDGGMQRRLRIRETSGGVHLFVVKHPDEAASQLRQLLGVPGARDLVAEVASEHPELHIDPAQAERNDTEHGVNADNARAATSVAPPGWPQP